MTTQRGPNITAFLKAPRQGHIMPRPVPVPIPAPHPPPPPPRQRESQGHDHSLRVIYDGFQAWSAESLEIEWRLGKLTKTQFADLTTTLRQSPHMKVMHGGTPQKTKEEFNGTDARIVTPLGPDGDPFTMYKKKLFTRDLGQGARFQVSLERQGEPETSRPYTMYRVKERITFIYEGLFRIDLTSVETNDPKYSDGDELLYEAEIEVITSSDGLYYYTMDHILEWGDTLCRELLQHVNQTM